MSITIRNTLASLLLLLTFNVAYATNRAFHCDNCSSAQFQQTALTNAVALGLTNSIYPIYVYDVTKSEVTGWTVNGSSGSYVAAQQVMS